MAIVEYMKLKIQIKGEKLVISKEENIQKFKYILSLYPPCQKKLRMKMCIFKWGGCREAKINAFYVTKFKKTRPSCELYGS